MRAFMDGLVLAQGGASKHWKACLGTGGGGPISLRAKSKRGRGWPLALHRSEIGRGLANLWSVRSSERWGPTTQSLTQFSRARVGMGWRSKPVM